MLTREQLSRNLGTNLERERFKLGYYSRIWQKH